MDNNYLTNAMNLGKEICVKKLKNGDVAVDATMGNGNDTVFLSRLVGEEGKVYAFDVQDSAIKNTREKLKNHNINGLVELINDGHENIDKYIKEKVKVIMFNLGYLPRAEHKVTTKPDTTLIAIQKSLELLQKNGVVILVIYHGHEEGKEEKTVIENFAKSLNQKEYNVIELSFVNQINNPPILVAIEKR
ncbi:tRNA (mnm(5)s(2)U34)-methyltransferase [Clostridium ganghwense]|uniref:Methyltransferase domain-containing protein n=1 Tax=Clostridium ganghwense TaxID=312089 RepID=A0ABT4CNU8_9CLOT|nr:class I SAM-dependent methyltransferase [Clostridium ganghwense]MCY6370730.1 methyltransferase domain-containing protein [Clostridium ganghwense]